MAANAGIPYDSNREAASLSDFAVVRDRNSASTFFLSSFYYVTKYRRQRCPFNPDSRRHSFTLTTARGLPSAIVVDGGNPATADRHQAPGTESAVPRKCGRRRNFRDSFRPLLR